MQEAIASAGIRYAITHIIFHQGESDYAIQTSEREYTHSLLSLVESIRTMKVEALFYLSVATKCGLPWEPKNPIALAQTKSVNARLGIVPGVNTDALILDVDRYDGCHFGYSGQQKFAEALREVLIQ